MTGYWKRWELRKKEALRLERKKLVKQILKDKTMNKSMKRILQGLLSVTLILGMVSCKKVVTQPSVPVVHHIISFDVLYPANITYYSINGVQTPNVVGSPYYQAPYNRITNNVNVKTGDVVMCVATGGAHPTIEMSYDGMNQYKFTNTSDTLSYTIK